MMKERARGYRRRGSIIFLVLVVMSVVFIAIVALGFLTRTDVSTTTNLRRELLATQLAEGIATQIEAQTNSTPWTRRIWLLEAMVLGTYTPGTGIVPSCALTKTSRFLNLSRDTLPSEEYDFVGIVKDDVDPDQDVPARDYRIYLEVTVEGSTFAFTWDKRWDQSLLVGLNRDTTQVDKSLGLLEAAPTGTDRLLDGITSTAVAVPPPDGSNAVQMKRIKKLRRDEKSFKAQALVGDPQNVPVALPKEK